MSSGFRRIRGTSTATQLATTAPPPTQAGSVSSPGVTSGTVVFPYAFTQTPKVLANAICAGGYNVVSVRVTGETATGFAWACYAISAGNEAPTLTQPTKLTWEATN